MLVSPILGSGTLYCSYSITLRILLLLTLLLLQML